MARQPKPKPDPEPDPDEPDDDPAPKAQASVSHALERLEDHKRQAKAARERRLAERPR